MSLNELVVVVVVENKRKQKLRFRMTDFSNSSPIRSLIKNLYECTETLIQTINMEDQYSNGPVLSCSNITLL